jgi:hypothetical protein
LRRNSASQIAVYSACKRKWAWHYVVGVEVPQHPAAAFGEEVHAQLARYLSGGPIDFTKESGYVAASGLQHLPRPRTPGMRVEDDEESTAFAFVGFGGHTYYSGYLDLDFPGTVVDHKTTGDLKWAKTPDQLRRDPQAVIYSVEYFRRHPDEPSVELRWVYYQTKKTKKSCVTSVHVTQIEIFERFKEIELISLEMCGVVDAAPESKSESDLKNYVLSLEANYDHCDAFNGCPHQGLCNISPLQRLHAHAAQDRERNKKGNLIMPNELFNRLQQGRAGAAVSNGTTGPALPASPLPAPAAAPVPAVPAATPAASSALAARLRGLAPAAPAAPPPAPPATVQAPQSPPGPAINPTGEWQPPPAPPAPPADASAAPQAAPAPAVGAEAPKRSSRKKVDAAAALASSEPRKVTDPPEKVIGVLYVDCGPVGAAAAQVVDASLFVSKAKSLLAEGGIADWRYVEYGEGAGKLAEAVGAVIDFVVQQGAIEAVRFDTGTAESVVTLFEFVSRARVVVR